jgi:hypothetical protein
MKGAMKEAKEALVLGFVVFAVFQFTANATPANTYVGDGFAFSYPEGWTPDSVAPVLTSADGTAFVEAAIVPPASLEALALVQIESPDRFPQQTVSIGGRSWTKTCSGAGSSDICRAFTKCGDNTVSVMLKELPGDIDHGTDYVDMLAHFTCW